MRCQFCGQILKTSSLKIKHWSQAQFVTMLRTKGPACGITEEEIKTLIDLLTSRRYTEKQRVTVGERIIKALS